MLPVNKHTGLDDYQTPPKALEPLLPYVPRDWIIWECAQGKGYLTDALRDNGYTVIGSDIVTGEDFLTWQPSAYDCIITNPPYSTKYKFLYRCYELGRPFALLLPLTTLETQKRQALFNRYGVELIVFSNRIHFIRPDGDYSTSWFLTAWFTNGLSIGKSLSFPYCHNAIQPAFC